jgi:hypothetical protein
MGSTVDQKRARGNGAGWRAGSIDLTWPVIAMPRKDALESPRGGMKMPEDRGPTPPHLRMVQLCMGAFVARAVGAAARLGLAEHLAAGPLGVDVLAERTGTHAPSLSRLLRVLVSAGVLDRDGDRFRLTAVGRTLRRDAPDSVLDGVLWLDHPVHTGSWSRLTDAVRTGDPGVVHAHGRALPDVLADDPEAAALFHGWMGRSTDLAATSLVAACDFSRFRRVMDVGGGRGAFLRRILEIHPEVHGILFDRPEVVREPVDIAGVDPGRYATVGGDFLSSVPEGADAYVLKHTLVDWPDEMAICILRNCRAAVAEDARLIVAEWILVEGGAPVLPLLDLNMLVMTSGGRIRTFDELAGLLSAAGFRAHPVRPTPAGVGVVEAEPV